MSENKSKFKLEIKLMENGEIKIDGPLDNKIVCFGMIEFARQAIANWQPPTNIIPITQLPNGRANHE